MNRHKFLPVPVSIRKIVNSTDRELAWQFFVFFSRFEYALKKDPRYLMSGKGDAKPNWDRFASCNNKRFIQLSESDTSLKETVEYFLAFPPRKQICRNGQLAWSEPLYWQKNAPLLVWLLLCIRTVRNNLFHGGKFPQFPVSDPSRNYELIEHSLVILSHCLTLDPTVERTFLEGIDD